MPCFVFIPEVFNVKSEGQKVNGRRIIGLGMAMQGHERFDTRLASGAANAHPFHRKTNDQP